MTGWSFLQPRKSEMITRAVVDRNQFSTYCTYWPSNPSLVLRTLTLGFKRSYKKEMEYSAHL